MTEYPIIVHCKLCKERIILREDSHEARERGQDPLQQLRRHLSTAHTIPEIADISHWSGWLTTMLVFKATQGQSRWRDSAHRLLDHFLDGEPE